MKTAKTLVFTVLVAVLGGNARDAAGDETRAHAGVDWAVEKFCGKFPAICKVVRDGRTCMERIAGVERAANDAMRRIWQAVPGVGEIVLGGWTLGRATELGKVALTKASEIVRAAGTAILECEKWARRSAGTLVVATGKWVGEKLCSIDPGTLVCPVLRATLECAAAAARAGVALSSKVKTLVDVWRGGVPSLTEENIRRFNVAEGKAAQDECNRAIARAGKRVEAVIGERKEWAREGLQALKNGDCGEIVEAFSKFDPQQQALNAFLPEFASSCAVKFKKGFICEIPDALKGAADFALGLAKTAWEKKLRCGAMTVLTMNPGLGFACVLTEHIKKQAPIMVASVRRIAQCLRNLSGKEWFNLIKDTLCEFAGAVALEVVLTVVTKGAAAGTWAARVGSFIHKNEVLLRAFSGAKAVGSEISHACGLGEHETAGGDHAGAGTGSHRSTTGSGGKTRGGHSTGAGTPSGGGAGTPSGGGAGGTVGGKRGNVDTRNAAGSGGKTPGSRSTTGTDAPSGTDTTASAEEEEVSDSGGASSDETGKAGGKPDGRKVGSGKLRLPSPAQIAKLEKCRKSCVKKRGKNKGCFKECRDKMRRAK